MTIDKAWEIRPGTHDHIVFDEVWREDVYRLRMHTPWPVDFAAGPVLDIGANVGAFTLRAIDLGAPHVCAVEPHPENVAQLLRNAELCGAADRVAVIRAAVHNVEGTVAMGADAGAGTHFVAGGAIEAPCVPFKTLLAGADAWSCLKMDVEGAEYVAFAGVTADDLAHVAHIVMEFHGNAMPHLAGSIASGVGLGGIIETLAEWGQVSVLGKPSVGGAIYGVRY